MNYRTSRGRFLIGVIVFLSLVACVLPARADVISYTTEVGQYEFQLEYSEEFGNPIKSANGLMFFPSPVLFCAQASGENGSDEFDGYFRAMITSLDGSPINTISLWEYGEYTLKGTGTIATEATVDVPIVVSTLFPSETLFFPVMTFRRPVVEPPQPQKPDGDYNLVEDSGKGILWHGSAECDVDQATVVVITLDNILSAGSEENSQAKILKKGFGIHLLVPEPSMLVLLISGACILFARRRR